MRYRYANMRWEQPPNGICLVKETRYGSHFEGVSGPNLNPTGAPDGYIRTTQARLQISVASKHGKMKGTKLTARMMKQNAPIVAINAICA